MQPDGTYIWSTALDMQQERKGYTIGKRICEITALLIFLGGAFFSIRLGSRILFLYTAVFAGIILLITSGVVHGLETWPGEQRRTYRMSDAYLKTGTGRKAGNFEFKRAKSMIVGKNYIELRARIEAFRLYIPDEDLDFVKEFIMSRIPGDCEVRYE